MKTLPFKFSRKGSTCTERFSYLDFTVNTRILASLAPEFPDLVKCLQLGEHLTDLTDFCGTGIKYDFSLPFLKKIKFCLSNRIFRITFLFFLGRSHCMQDSQ